MSVGALLLMLVAAWAGDRSAPAADLARRPRCWPSPPPSCPASATRGGTAFYGLFVADAFAAFSKIVIYAAAAVSMLAAMSWFGRDRDYRAEYPVLILFSAVGMGMMVSRRPTCSPSMSASSCRASPPTSSRASSAATRARPRPASNISCSARSPRASCSTASRCSTASPAPPCSAASPHALGHGVSSGALIGLVFVLAGLAFKVSAVPFHMWTPDVYEGAPTPVTAFFASAPKVAAMALLIRVAVESLGPATDAWRQIVIFMALASTVLGGVAAIGQKNIKRLLAYSSINNVGFALVGLAAAGVVGRRLGAVLHERLCRDDAGRLPRRPAGCATRTISRSRRSPASPACRAPGRCSRWRWRCSCSASPASRPCSASGPSSWCSSAAVEANLTWLAAVAIATSVIGAYYYIMIVKLMYFDEPAPAFAETKEPVGAALILAAALFVSPLGYLA